MRMHRASPAGARCRGRIESATLRGSSARRPRAGGGPGWRYLGAQARVLRGCARERMEGVRTSRPSTGSIAMPTSKGWARVVSTDSASRGSRSIANRHRRLAPVSGDCQIRMSCYSPRARARDTGIETSASSASASTTSGSTRTGSSARGAGGSPRRVARPRTCRSKLRCFEVAPPGGPVLVWGPPPCRAPRYLQARGRWKHRRWVAMGDQPLRR